MQEVIFTIGIPGSGKSRWAREFQSNNRHYMVSERDIIREGLSTDGDINKYKYTKAKEKEVTTTQMDRILSSLSMGCSVIVADTNLNWMRRQLLRSNIRVKYPDVKFVYKVFDTSLKTCIKRNMKRDKSVPESVLVRMEMQMREYLGKIRYSGPQDGRKRCIVVDIDGTVADMSGIRGPFDWAKVGNDRPIYTNINVVRNYINSGGADLIFFSGRDGSCRAETEKWLDDYFYGYQLYMRPEGSQLSDDIIKEKLYEDHVHGKYNVDFIMDDRKQVCQMWESMGLPLINVGGTLSDF